MEPFFRCLSIPSQQIHLKLHPPTLLQQCLTLNHLLFHATKQTYLCVRNLALFGMRLLRIRLQLQPSIKSTTSTGISILKFTSTYTSTSTTSSYFHKQSFFPDIKPLQLSHIPFISVADFGANIRRVLAEQLSQFHSYQSFTNAGNDAPISLPTVTNAGSSTTLV
ncbi:hypothetical protein BCR33DRAFT_728278 [Rhizoclosmatium globosum]|uniref:Uncharacterized protein n=1 Tax=Rhizoclosmatium globosum TaxID=329046 RepID=A0A1Y2AKK2_9FUNG|nr:hypothetical protein BCR33DRAFT_728278 [Rhizoclosmatium globosum]|eukprot:ORY23083.1 hypothetical protein BCR33DRAFT_728278 [Rhizoclosmatium globosum]